MEALRRTFRLIRVNWRTLVCFELFYKAAVAVGFTLLVSLGFRLVMRVMGLSYLTREGIGGFLLHPLTLTLLVSLALLAISCFMIDICAVAYILDCSAQAFRCRMRQVLRFTLYSAPRIWRPENIPLAGILLLLAPFLSLSMLCGLLATVSLPEIVQEFIRLNPLPFALAPLLVLLIPLLLARRLFVFHYFALEGSTFREAWRRSAALGHPLKNYGALLLAQTAFTALMVLALALLASLLGRDLNLVFHRPWLVGAVV